MQDTRKRVLKDLHPKKRAGARVIAPDGAEALFWGTTERRKYTTVTDGHLAGQQIYCGVVREAWLWRDGALLDPVMERQARELELVASHPIYRAGFSTCLRRDAHVWPGDLGDPDAACERCGLPYAEYGEFESPTIF